MLRLERAGEDGGDVRVLRRRGGPATAVAAKNGVGFTSPEAFAVEVDAAPIGDLEANFHVPGEWAERVIEPGDELTYCYFPVGGAEYETLYDATAFALDLEFDDGSFASADIRFVDAYGAAVTPRGQAEAKMLWPDQWNRRRVSLAAFAGRTVRRVVARATASPRAPIRGFLDDVTIAAAPPVPTRPLDLVSTTRGTHSSGRFSRGNTAPIVAIPHGGVFGIPMTDAAAANWPYAYHAHNRDPDNRPAIQAFATSHLPSPWIGDRGVFQVMPSPLRQPAVDRRARALGFRHDEEQARPHLYDVRLEGGIRARMTAADFALGLRFDFAGTAASIVLDHHGRIESYDVRSDGTDLLIDLELDDRADVPHHYVHVSVPRVIRNGLRLRRGRLSGSLAIDISSDATVDVLIGISTIGSDEAVANLRAAGGFERMLADAEREWTRLLDTIELDGAPEDVQRNVFSDLYRLFLYPNRHSEAPTGAPRYRSPFGAALATPIRSEPAPEVRPGVFSANNGFWDTYRTCWPALNLLTPDDAGTLAQGFVQHFVDGGWVSRWSAPGAIDSMTGTTSDTVFAAAAVARVRHLDLDSAYRSAVRNATVPSLDRRVGRTGIRPGIFRGYVATDTHEGMSWTLDNAINDWSIAQLARLLGERAASASERARFRTEHEYFARRSLGYRAVFHRELGFFVGRDADGRWRADGADYDPAVWGFDYTETNGWGTAFTVPHDGRGLAELHGGERRLGEALDRFFATPETGEARNAGSYGFAIHEMAEARDVRMGMLGLSNQPAHHIPFMYMFAGRHDDAHRIVADARSRLFAGSDIGQGYPGDEDNGEMSAWYVFVALGLYPLVPASGSYVLIPPMVPRATIRPIGGAPVTIRVTDATAGGRYVRAVRVNGEPWHDISIGHDLLVAGADIEFELSDTPHGWAAASRPLSASELHGYRDALADRTVPGSAARVVSRVPDAARLFDDRGSETVRLAPGESVEYRFDVETPLGLYTVTAAEPGAASWTLEREAVDGEWAIIDSRVDEPFEWAGQTRPFTPVGVAASIDGSAVAVRFTAASRCVLHQLEFFAPSARMPARAGR
jgi:predicted alpha-1,2-mannosidase